MHCQRMLLSRRKMCYYGCTEYSMIIFLFGKDTFRSRQRLKQLVDKFKVDRDPQGYNVVSLDASTIEKPARILEEVLAVPFLATRRCIVIERLLSSKHKEVQQEILDRITAQKIPDTNVVMLWEETDTFKTKEGKQLFEQLGKEKFTQQFDPLVGIKLSQWIVQEVKDRGGVMQSVAVQYVVNQGAGDMWRLSSLIDQLIAYANGREITLADIQLFLDEKVDDNIFNLVDAVVAKQDKKVYQMIQEQYRKGEDAQYIFAMLLRQFRILLTIRDLYDREKNISSDTVAKLLKLHPFVVKKSVPLVQRYAGDELKKIYRGLLDMDIGVKTGQGEASLLLDVLVGKICYNV